MEMRHCCRLLDNVTYAPIGLIALYGDVLNLRAMRRLLRDHVQEVKILGRIVTRVFVPARSLHSHEGGVAYPWYHK